MTDFRLTAEHEHGVTQFALELGLPENAVQLYLEAVTDSWSDALSNVVMREYASIIDVTSPDYREAMDEQNNRLIMLRAHFQTTEAGKATIKKIPKKQDDGYSTIPLPTIPQELLDGKASRKFGR
jgi:hypothetical protein